MYVYIIMYYKMLQNMFTIKVQKQCSEVDHCVYKLNLKLIEDHFFITFIRISLI